MDATVIPHPAHGYLNAAIRFNELLFPFVQAMQLVEKDMDARSLKSLSKKHDVPISSVVEMNRVKALGYALCDLDIEAEMPELRRLLATIRKTPEHLKEAGTRIAMMKKKPRKPKSRRGRVSKN